MKDIFIKTEFIKLDQFLKYANILHSGGISKEFIKDGNVSVNGQVETRRGKKLYENDKVFVNGQEYIIKKEI